MVRSICDASAVGASRRLSPQWAVELPGTQILGAAVGATSLVVSTYDGVTGGKDAVVAAVDLRTGVADWIDRAGRRTTAAVVVAGRLAVSVDRTATATARAIETGRVRWTRKLRARATETPTWALAAGGGRIFVGGEPVGLVALDATSGKPVWASDPLFVEVQHPAMALARGRLLVVDTQQLVSVEVANHRMSSWVWGRGEEFGFSERPVVHGVVGGLVVASIGATLLAADVFGPIRWSNTFDGRVVGAAPTTDGIVILVERTYDANRELMFTVDAVGHRRESVLIGIDLAGVERWARPVDGHCEVGTLGEVALLLEAGTVAVLDARTGATNARADCPGLDGFLAAVGDQPRLLGASRHGTRVTAWDLAELVTK